MPRWLSSLGWARSRNSAKMTGSPRGRRPPLKGRGEVRIAADGVAEVAEEAVKGPFQTRGNRWVAALLQKKAKRIAYYS